MAGYLCSKRAASGEVWKERAGETGFPGVLCNVCLMPGPDRKLGYGSLALEPGYTRGWGGGVPYALLTGPPAKPAAVDGVSSKFRGWFGLKTMG